MSLQVEYVNRLSDVLAPALEYLRQPVDIFAKQHIVVPTAGVKAWLMSDSLAHFTPQLELPHISGV